MRVSGSERGAVLMRVGVRVSKEVSEGERDRG